MKLKKAYSGVTSMDWTSIDNELAEKVKSVAKSIYAQSPPRRIVRYMIINAPPKYDKNYLLLGPSKVPESWKVLLHYKESKEDYQIRHTPAIVRQLLRDGYTNVTLNSILSFRRSYRGCSERVKKEIIKILHEMGFKNVERERNSKPARTNELY